MYNFTVNSKQFPAPVFAARLLNNVTFQYVLPTQVLVYISSMQSNGSIGKDGQGPTTIVDISYITNHSLQYVAQTNSFNENPSYLLAAKKSSTGFKCAQ